MGFDFKVLAFLWNITKHPRFSACAGGETISNKTFGIICVLGAIFLSSGINGILAIFLDVEGDPSENKLQGVFQAFMILTIVCSLFVSSVTS